MSKTNKKFKGVLSIDSGLIQFDYSNIGMGTFKYDPVPIDGKNKLNILNITELNHNENNDYDAINRHSVN